MSAAPICLFVFNRLTHTQKTIESLLKNELSEQSDLFIFSDGPRRPEEEDKVRSVRDYIREISGFKSVIVIERERNWGLAQSIISGVTDIVNRYGKVIVLEDDLVTSPYFLRYMNDGLDLYKNEPQVASIHGYVYPVDSLPTTFFIKGADCWGWATWKDRWEKFNPDGSALLKSLREKGLTKEFEFNGSYPYIRMLKGQISGKNNSWAIRWYASAFLNDLYTLYPGKSLVQNIGNDNSGTHCTTTDEFDVDLCMRPIFLEKIPIENHKVGYQKFIEYFRRHNVSRWKRILPAIKRRLFQRS